MKLLYSKGAISRPVEESDVDTFVVYDAYDNPIFFAYEVGGMTISASAADPKFADMLKSLGITKRLRVERRELEC